MNRRSVVLLISVACVYIFASLAYYGWKNRWGAPMDTTIEVPLTLAMPYVDKQLQLAVEDFDDSIWQTLQPITVQMLHQISVPPRSETLVPQIDVRAFHDGSDAYFLIEWKDEAPNRVHGIDKFPDGVAAGFSLDREPPKASIMMGFQSTLNVWHWKADLDGKVWGIVGEDRYTSNVHYSYRQQTDIPTSEEKPTSACQDLLAIRPGTITPQTETSLTGRGRWQNGAWRVIIKRPMTTDDPERDAQFVPGRMNATFAVWNGDEGDRGSRKSISDWVFLEVGSQSKVPESPAPAIGLRETPHPVTPRGREMGVRTVLAGFGSPAILAAVSAAPAETPGEDAEPRVITILAKRFEYNPSKIVLQKGELVTLRLESLDVTHGLYLDGYDINIKARPGVIGKATFRADKSGRFTFRCSETCGAFHPYMIGFLTVEPNTRYLAFIACVVGVSVLAAGIVCFSKKRKETA